MHSQDLPHLSKIVAAFFKSAHQKWITFTEEFHENETVAKMSVEKKSQSFLHPTNDWNEGALGCFHVILCCTPNLSLRQYNAHMLIKYNDVVQFLKTSVTPEQREAMQK
jgi:hypothetical protein